MANQIMVIAPYWLDDAGTWVFDDEAKDLTQEPFVQGIPQMIDGLVAEIPNAGTGFRLLFSASPFPGYQKRTHPTPSRVRRMVVRLRGTGGRRVALPSAVAILSQGPESDLREGRAQTVKSIPK